MGYKRFIYTENLSGAGWVIEGNGGCVICIFNEITVAVTGLCLVPLCPLQVPRWVMDVLLPLWLITSQPLMSLRLDVCCPFRPFFDHHGERLVHRADGTYDPFAGQKYRCRTKSD